MSNPPWRSHNRRHYEAMVRWLNGELDKIFDQRVEDRQREAHAPENVKRWDDWYAEHGPQIEAAERGNVEPLRQALPRYAEFIHPPRRKRGQHFLKYKSKLDPVDPAVEDVNTIRTLLKQRYGTAYGSGAEQIAADRWEVDVEKVIQRMKKTRPAR